MTVKNMFPINRIFPRPLTERDETLYIVVHHTTGPQNQDICDIWDDHIAKDYNGIGYHRIISGKGSTFMGRPILTYGAHAENYNHCSVGISLMGNFEFNYYKEVTDENGVVTYYDEEDNVVEKIVPTKEQIAALKENIVDLFKEFPDAVVCGHKKLNQTACPGNILYEMLPTIVAEIAAEQNLPNLKFLPTMSDDFSEEE